jgi:hypothetical protein
MSREAYPGYWCSHIVLLRLPEADLISKIIVTHLHSSIPSHMRSHSIPSLVSYEESSPPAIRVALTRQIQTEDGIVP